MRRKIAGFTLVEMLVVVMIAAAVVVWSVPSYKNAKNRSRYDAGKGLLIDLGGAVMALRGDLSMVNKKYPTDNSTLQVTKSTVQDVGSTTMYDYVTHESMTSNAQFSKGLIYYDYLPKIAFDSSGNTYRGYSFYVCPVGVVGTGCCTTANTVACMVDSSADAKYRQARYLTTSEVERDGA